MNPDPTTSPSFWQQIPQPMIGLAPMDGVTDSAFRHIVALHGKPDLTFTEFTNVHDICSGRLKALDSLCYSEIQRPVIAQIYGKDPALFYQAAHVVCELGFDGLDINMGCPSKNVASSGSGAGLIRTPTLALELMTMAQKGIQDWAAGQTLAQAGLKTKALEAIAQLHHNHAVPRIRKPIPLSVKTRIGYDRNMIDDWSACLIQGKPAVISIHGRTLSQMYKGQSDWETIARAASLIQPHRILVLGNGDIRNLGEAATRIRESGVNGVLIGRGSLGNPWVFRGISHLRESLGIGTSYWESSHSPSLEETFKIMVEHASLFEQIHGSERFVRMRKHLGWYCSGFPHAAAMRAQLVRTHSTQDVENLITQYHTHNQQTQVTGLPTAIAAS
ncbi:MAG: tRNA-dihydrouridine synthase [Nitrospiraceae bacterium]|nr:tRNA-dihydrouridine synthase [Nitrospiraceae bacterium]